MTEKIESIDAALLKNEEKQITVTVIEPSRNNATIFNASSKKSNQTENDANQSSSLIDKRPQLVVTPVLQIQRTLETTPPNKSVNFKENRNQTQADLHKIEFDEVLVDFEGTNKRVNEDEKKNLEYLQQKMAEQSL